MVSFLLTLWSLKIEVTYSSETSVEFYRTTRLYVPEDINLQLRIACIVVDTYLLPIRRAGTQPSHLHETSCGVKMVLGLHWGSCASSLRPSALLRHCATVIWKQEGQTPLPVISFWSNVWYESLNLSQSLLFSARRRNLFWKRLIDIWTMGVYKWKFKHVGLSFVTRQTDTKPFDPLKTYILSDAFSKSVSSSAK
jgi:hypothetical protein